MSAYTQEKNAKKNHEILSPKLLKLWKETSIKESSANYMKPNWYSKAQKPRITFSATRIINNAQDKRRTTQTQPIEK